MPKVIGIDKSGSPVGVPMAAPFTSDLPVGTLLCDGALYLVATYPSLAAKLGDTFGGDGIVDFGVPDMRGRSILGMDDMTVAGSAEGAAGVVTNAAADLVGGILGEENHLMTEAEMPSHDHDITVENTVSDGGGNNHVHTGFYTNYLTNTTSIAATGGDVAHNNMSPGMAMVWVIPFA